MPSRTVTVGSSIGLHARPAATIAQIATDTGVPVTLAVAGEEPVDAGSALLIMTLGAKFGDEVVVESDDQAALDVVASRVGMTGDNVLRVSMCGYGMGRRQVKQKNGAAHAATRLTQPSLLEWERSFVDGL